MPSFISVSNIYGTSEINFMRKCYDLAASELVFFDKYYDVDELTKTVFHLYQSGIREEKYLSTLAIQVVSGRKQSNRDAGVRLSPVS